MSDACELLQPQSTEKGCHKFHIAFPTFNHHYQKYGRVSERVVSSTRSGVDHLGVKSWRHYFCITLGKLLNLHNPQPLLLQNEDIIHPHTEKLSTVSGMWQVLNEC